MRNLPQWALEMLATPRETQTINFAVATNDPEEATSMLFRLHLLHAYAKVMQQSPDSIEDPLLRLMVRLSDESSYPMARDNTTWAALFTILRDNGPRQFVSWVDQNRDRFYLDDFGEIAAFVYEDSRGDIVDRFPGLIEKAKDLGESAQRASARNASTRSTGGTKQGGCYVATYVYGTYDSPELWVLRRWRDEYLAQSALGRAFISAYYTVSPKLIRHVGGQRAFARLATHAVGWAVDRLQRAGVSNSKYDGG